MKKCFLCQKSNKPVLAFGDESFKKCYLKILFRKKKGFKYHDVQLTKDSRVTDKLLGYHTTCYKKITALQQKYHDQFHAFVRNYENPNPFQIELVPHFDPTAQGVTTETNNLDQIKQEVEDYDPLSPPSLKQDFKSEDSLSKPASSSHIDTILGSNESNNDVYIKTECDDDNTFEIEGRQYAEDLKLLLPQQRDIVRQLVANIICRAKMNLLSLEESCPQL